MYNATGAADDLSDATNTLQKTPDFTQAVTNNHPTDSVNNGE